jgi:hypothetical protein
VLRSGGVEVLSVAMLGTGKGPSSQATGGSQRVKKWGEKRKVGRLKKWR